MKKEKNNFARAVEWLRENGKIKDQKDMAERMGVTTTTISRNKHGSVKRPDEDTLRKFNEQFGDIINIAYLRCESDVMLVADLPQKNRRIDFGGGSAAVNTNGVDALTAALIAAKDETIDAMKRELAAKDGVIAAKDGQLADRDRLVVAKDALIANLQQQVDSFREQLSALQMQTAIEKGLQEVGGRLHSAPAELRSVQVP